MFVAESVLQFDFVILVAGFKSRQSSHQCFYEIPVTIPSLHVFGDTDKVIDKGTIFFIRLDLTHQIRSYRDSKNKEIKDKSEKEAERGSNFIGRRQWQLKIQIKKEKNQLLFVWSLSYNLSDFSSFTMNIKVPAIIAYKIIETHKPP